MKNFTEKVGEKHAISNTVLGNTFDAPKILGTKKPTLSGLFENRVGLLFT